MGNALIDLAKAAELTVIGVVGSEEKARFARAPEADYVINRKTEKIGERVREITRNRGVDIIIDPVAGPSIPDNSCFAGALRHARALRRARRKGAASICSRRCGSSKEPPAVRAIHHPHMGRPRRGASRRHDRRHRNAGRRQTASAHPLLACRSPKVRRAHEMLESGAVLGKLLLQP